MLILRVYLGLLCLTLLPLLWCAAALSLGPLGTVTFIAQWWTMGSALYWWIIACVWLVVGS